MFARMGLFLLQRHKTGVKAQVQEVGVYAIGRFYPLLSRLCSGIGFFTKTRNEGRAEFVRSPERSSKRKSRLQQGDHLDVPGTQLS